MRDIPVGNGSLLVNFDDKYQIRDIYFPHAGQENHTEGFPFRFGVWVDGVFSWVFDDGWNRDLRYLQGTLVTNVTLTNDRIAVKIVCSDTVAGRENIYLRRIIVTDTSGTSREVRVFLHHDFRIYENKVGDTAFFDPDNRAIVHYKKHRYFLINTQPGFDSFATGRKAFGKNEGTWRDAEDGNLQGGPITEGSVDSTIGVHFRLDANASHEFYYWIAAAASHREVDKLNSHALERGPEKYFSETEEHWRSWVNKNDIDFADLPEDLVRFYKRCLLTIHTQIDHDGAIIAANDSDVSERATDNYSYSWMRDGSFVANALDSTGYPEISRKFFEFCAKCMHPNGYFFQKYNPDGTLGSSWHPRWDSYRNIPMVPIQEDETALVLWALWRHFEKDGDVEFAKSLYESMIVPCADFMLEFRDPNTKLPNPSWNLWEDRLGVHTFTCSTVVAGLRAAANFARTFNEPERAETYERAAGEIVEAMREHLYSDQLGRFLRSLQANGDELTPDQTIDASLFGVFYFGCFDVNDLIVEGTMRAVEENLTNNTEFGGVARFQNDDYMRVADSVTGNSWFICTIWIAEYYLAKATAKSDLARALEILQWVHDRALPSGVLAEQVNPLTGEDLSVSPLTWSHSTFVTAVNSYLTKLASFGQ